MLNVGVHWCLWGNQILFGKWVKDKVQSQREQELYEYMTSCWLNVCCVSPNIWTAQFDFSKLALFVIEFHYLWCLTSYLTSPY